MEKEDSPENIQEGQNKPESTPVLSKNQLKKLKRQEQWDKEKEVRKQKKKEKEKEKRRKKNELLNKQVEEDKPKEIIMKEPRKVREEQILQKMNEGIIVCIDCDFEDLMTDKEIISMCRQITEIYSRNRKSANPFQVILLGLGDKLFTNLKKNGFENWLGFKFIRKNDEKEFYQANQSKFMYLTGDSEHTVNNLSKENIYLIGGIVDRNRHKLLTLTKANNLGIKHAKLPIGEYIDLKSSKVMTTNHVFDILSYYHGVKEDWKEAFMSIIPHRKLDK